MQLTSASVRGGTRIPGRQGATVQEPKWPGHAVGGANILEPIRNPYRANPNIHRPKHTLDRERIQSLHSEEEVGHISRRSARRRRPYSDP